MSVNRVNFNSTVDEITDVELSDLQTTNTSASDRIEIATTGAGGDITISQIKTAGTIVVTSVNGAIKDGSDASPELVGNAAVLRAQVGIGHDNALETSLALVAASNNSNDAAKSDIEIENSRNGGLLTIGTVDSPGTGDDLAGATNKKGDIIVTNLSPLTVADAITTDQGGDIRLTAAANDSNAADTDHLTIHANVTTGFGGNIVLTAGDNIVVQPSSGAAPTIETSAILAATATPVTTTVDAPNMSAQIRFDAGGSITLASDVKLQRSAGTNETVKIDVLTGGVAEQGVISINAGKDLSLGSNVSVTAATNKVDKTDDRKNQIPPTESPGRDLTGPVERDLGLINVTAGGGFSIADSVKDSVKPVLSATTESLSVSRMNQVVVGLVPVSNPLGADPLSGETALISLHSKTVSDSNGNGSIFGDDVILQTQVGATSATSSTNVTKTVPPFFSAEDNAVPLVDISGRTSLTMTVGTAGTNGIASETNLIVIVDWGDRQSDFQHTYAVASRSEGSEDVADVPNATVFLIPTGGASYRFYHTYNALESNNRPNPAAAFPISFIVRHNNTVAITVEDGKAFGGTDLAQATNQFRKINLEAELPGVLGAGGEQTAVEVREIDLATTTVTDVIADNTPAPTATQNEEASAVVIQTEVSQVRIVLLRVIAPNGDTIGKDIRLDENVLDDLPKLFERLPDGRYRIYLQEAGEKQARLIISVRVLEGKAAPDAGEGQVEEKKNVDDTTPEAKQKKEEKKDADAPAKKKAVEKAAKAGPDGEEQSRVDFPRPNEVDPRGTRPTNTDDEPTVSDDSFWEDWQPKRKRTEQVAVDTSELLPGSIPNIAVGVAGNGDVESSTDATSPAAAALGAAVAVGAAARWSDRVDTLMGRFKKGSVSAAARLVRKLKRRSK